MQTSKNHKSLYANKTKAELMCAQHELQQEISSRDQFSFPEPLLDFRTLVENSEDIITLLDSDGVVVYQSPACKKILGYAPEEHVGTRAIHGGRYLSPERTRPGHPRKAVS